MEKAIDQGKRKSQALERQANALRRKLTGVNRKKVALAQDIQGLESEMNDLEREIAELNGAEDEKKYLLASRRRQFAQLLAALQRLSRLPPEAVIAYPDRPANLVRAAILRSSAGISRLPNSCCASATHSTKRSLETASTTIGMKPWFMPQSSEHCP